MSWRAYGREGMWWEGDFGVTGDVKINGNFSLNETSKFKRTRTGALSISAPVDRWEINVGEGDFFAGLFSVKDENNNLLQSFIHLGTTAATSYFEVTGGLKVDKKLILTSVAKGTATLSGGTVTVSNTNVASTDKIFLSRKTLGTSAGHLSYTISNGVSFTITSSDASDDGQIDWMLIGN